MNNKIRNILENFLFISVFLFSCYFKCMASFDYIKLLTILAIELDPIFLKFVFQKMTVKKTIKKFLKKTKISMLSGYEAFKNISETNNILMRNNKFNKTVQKFTILPIFNIDIVGFDVSQSLNKSKVIVVDSFEKK